MLVLRMLPGQYLSFLEKANLSLNQAHPHHAFPGKQPKVCQYTDLLNHTSKIPDFPRRGLVLARLLISFLSTRHLLLQISSPQPCQHRAASSHWTGRWAQLSWLSLAFCATNVPCSGGILSVSGNQAVQKLLFTSKQFSELILLRVPECSLFSSLHS